MSEEHLFAHRALGFSLRKLPHYHFLPTPWALSGRRRLDAELRDALAQASAPFVTVQHDHGQPDRVLSTFQATARPMLTVAPLDALLAQLEAQLTRLFPAASLELASADAVVAGQRAVLIQLVTALETQAGDVLPFRSRSYLVPRPPLAFSLGLSTSTEPAYDRMDELLSMLQTVRFTPARV